MSQWVSTSYGSLSHLKKNIYIYIYMVIYISLLRITKYNTKPKKQINKKEYYYTHKARMMSLIDI